MRKKWSVRIFTKNGILSLACLSLHNQHELPPLMQLLDGKSVSQTVKEEIRVETQQYLQQGYRPPKLVAILVGENAASQTYVKNKMRSCEYVGFASETVQMPVTTSEAELIAKVKSFNHDPDTDGIIVQMPLPDHLPSHVITRTILPRKDVDGFHPANVGMVTLNFPGIISATPKGVLELLSRYNIQTKGKHCVVVGRSRIVGRPMSILMSRGGYPGEATVTICHIHTPPELLKQLCLQADILIVAVGKPGLISGEMVKEGAVVIDIGISRVAAPERKSGFKLKGDVDFESVAPKTSFITPVPGGVGPMTVAMLLQNTLEVYKTTFSLD